MEREIKKIYKKVFYKLRRRVKEGWMRIIEKKREKSGGGN